MKIEEGNSAEFSGAKANPFNVPDGYFENLPAIIVNEIKAIPAGEKTTSENPFNVPDRYFEKLPALIKSNISAELNVTPRFFRRQLAVPAIFIFLVCTGLYFIKQRQLINEAPVEFTYDEVYNSTYFETLDEDLFVDVLELQKENTVDENLEQYLLDNNIEISQIENKL